ncbi:uncharacterized protein DUF370 [Keratinibaculum paraultunense]|uniref:Uncharacterized protein DUF370 n=1 Tax=Keratinibaculum paraultunense TaxID=1278232 RepID=A0A4R3KRC7_9FIRM|nr:DUF370 domain-containing protein [Keratinibaculum paraultunense]QQY79767.1 DUF370 domain-containing protein [Keratinibaculum paraultunense]TCS86923.1 uncharacterized protein DUF370 [Keratinibaculum paraultunense]
MFLHIGNNISIPKDEIVAILDKNAVEKSIDTRTFIDKLINNDCLVNPDNNKVNTYIITCIKNIDRKNRLSILNYNLYTSNISSKSLFKRK